MRDLVVKTWDLYEPHAEKGFLYDFQGRHFSQRWWEMYLWYLLDKMGLSLNHPGRGMPDAHAVWRNRSLYFECVSPTPGIGENKIPEFPRGIAHAVPQDEVTLRMTSVIADKTIQAEKRQKKTGLDHYLIALDTSHLHGSGFDEEFCIRSLYPIGHQKVTFYPNSEKEPEWSYEFRDEIQRPGRGSVSTSAFLNTTSYRQISAVLFCNANIGNIAAGDKPGIMLVHNHHAQSALSKKVFRRDEQYVWNGHSSLVRRGPPGPVGETLEEVLDR